MQTQGTQRLLAGLSLALAALAQSKAAQAYMSHSGKNCMVQGPSSAFYGHTPALGHYPGTSNSNQNLIFAFCPIDLGTQPNACVGADSAVVRYVDNTPNDSFFCQVRQFSYNGLLFFSGAGKYTCSQAGGCADSTTTFVGNNYLSLPGPGTNCIDQDTFVWCSMPQTYNNKMSSVVSYYTP